MLNVNTMALCKKEQKMKSDVTKIQYMFNQPYQPTDLVSQQNYSITFFSNLNQNTIFLRPTQTFQIMHCKQTYQKQNSKL